MSIEEWGTPISKDKIIYRRNKLIELAKVEATPYTIWYETVNENILDINYMIYEIDRLNNIIEDLEKHIEERITYYCTSCSNIYEDSLGKTRLVNEDIFNELTNIKEKLQELKEGKE